MSLDEIQIKKKFLSFVFRDLDFFVWVLPAMVPAGFRWFSGGSFWRIFSLFFSKHNTALGFSESNDISPVSKTSTIDECWRPPGIPSFDPAAFHRFLFSIIECF